MGWPISLCAGASAQKCFSAQDCPRASWCINLNSSLFICMHICAFVCPQSSASLLRFSFFFPFPLKQKEKKKNKVGSHSVVVATPGLHQDPDCQQANLICSLERFDIGTCWVFATKLIGMLSKWKNSSPKSYNTYIFARSFLNSTLIAP